MKRAKALKDLELLKPVKKFFKDYWRTNSCSPRLCDLTLISGNVDIPVYAQHVDAIEPGSKTGWSSAEAIKLAGAVGTLLNHSEHPMKFSDIKFEVERGKKLELMTCVCFDDIEMNRICATLEPDFIAIEPPELIGGEQSVVDADPEIVVGQ